MLVENEINIESVSLWATTKGDGKECFAFQIILKSYKGVERERERKRKIPDRFN